MIKYELDGNLAVVTINRPEKHNSLTLAMREHLRDLFSEIRCTPTIRGVLLTAAGQKAFCSGADVGELRNNDTRRDFDSVTNPLIINLHRIGKPVVAAINGVAVGMGWSLALASDFVVASEEAEFSQIFRNVGLAPDAGAIWFLSRAVGSMRAKELVLSARFVSATEAAELGLVQEIVAADELLPRALQLAHELANGPTLAFARSKQLFDAAQTPSLEQHLKHEADYQCALVRSLDHKEALDAFSTKRKPDFRGA